MPSRDDDAGRALLFPGTEMLFWFCGLDVLHGNVSLAQENREYLLALRDRNVCSVAFVSASKHLDGHAGDRLTDADAPGSLADLEAFPWVVPRSRTCELALVVLDAFDLAGAGYPLELVRRCAASMYPGARVALVLRFIADTDTCWVPRRVLEAVDLLWVPSGHSAGALPADCAPRTAVVPEVCHPPACPPPSAPAASEPLVFLAVMNDYGLDDQEEPMPRGPHSWNAARKNLAGLLEAFCSEFAGGAPPLPRLLVKSTRPGLAASVARFLEDPRRKLPPGGSAPGRVGVVGGWLPDIGDFLRLGHCVVAPSRGEGWCRPLAEALLAGMPAVGSAFGGQSDFLTEETGYPVRAELVECSFELGRGWADRGRWGEVDAAELRRALRRVAEDYGEALARARAGRAWVARHCSPAAVAAAVAERVVRRLLPPRVPATPQSVGTFELVD